MRTDTIVTAHLGNNADVFPMVAQLYIPEGSRVLDMTWGKGVFWRQLDIGSYNLTRNDLLVDDADTHEDFRATSFENESFDVVVLDPPYMRTNNTAGIMASNYNNQAVNLRTHNEVLQYYLDGIREARRLLRERGIMVLKCQDEIESSKQKWTHLELIALEGFVAEDLFVVVSSKTPLRGRCQERQLHARKNHSYFIVQRKVNARRPNPTALHSMEPH